MKQYDFDQPLIALHIPKTGGVSCKRLYKEWFGDNLFYHYFNEKTGEMPEKRDIFSIHTRERPVAVYGHFNRSRNFGVEHYYPEARQFVAVLRDPFERAVSGYFYLRKYAADYRDQSTIPESDLRDYLRVMDPKITLLNHFPRPVTMDNFVEIIETFFVEIGITERLEESMKRIALKLNKLYGADLLGTLNMAERDQRVPYEYKEEFIENNRLEYAIYDYVSKEFNQTS